MKLSEIINELVDLKIRQSETRLKDWPERHDKRIEELNKMLDHYGND